MVRRDCQFCLHKFLSTDDKGNPSGDPDTIWCTVETGVCKKCSSAISRVPLRFNTREKQKYEEEKMKSDPDHLEECRLESRNTKRPRNGKLPGCHGGIEESEKKRARLDGPNTPQGKTPSAGMGSPSQSSAASAPILRAPTSSRKRKRDGDDDDDDDDDEDCDDGDRRKDNVNHVVSRKLVFKRNFGWFWSNWFMTEFFTNWTEKPVIKKRVKVGGVDGCVLGSRYGCEDPAISEGFEWLADGVSRKKELASAKRLKNRGGRIFHFVV